MSQLNFTSPVPVDTIPALPLEVRSVCLDKPCITDSCGGQGWPWLPVRRAIRSSSTRRRLSAGHAEAFTMAKIISVANQKGGVGKTTTAINLAAGLAKAGRTALVVDVDPQCNATSGLGVAPAPRHPLVAGQPLADSVVETTQPGLFVLPGSQSLADADALSASNRQRAATLRQQLTGELGRFDYVFLDCPPSLGQLTRAALWTSAAIYIPIQCEYFAMEGLSQIIDLARQTKARDNHRLEIGGIVLTMFDPGAGACQRSGR